MGEFQEEFYTYGLTQKAYNEERKKLEKNREVSKNTIRNYIIKDQLVKALAELELYEYDTFRGKKYNNMFLESK